MLTSPEHRIPPSGDDKKIHRCPGCGQQLYGDQRCVVCEMLAQDKPLTRPKE